MDQVLPLCAERQERLRQNTLLLRRKRCPEASTSYVPPDSWKLETDKCYRRPNIKLRKAQVQLTQSLRNNSLRFYKHMGHLQRTCHSNASRDTLGISQFGRNSRCQPPTPTYDTSRNCGSEETASDSNLSLRKEGLNVDTSYSPADSRSSSRYTVDQKHCAADQEATTGCLDFCSQNTAKGLVARDVNVKKHDFTWGVQKDKNPLKPRVNTINQKEEDSIVLKRKEQAKRGISGDVTMKKLFVRFEGLSTAVDIPNVKTADDWKRPLDLTQNTDRSRSVPRRFCRSCVKFQSDSERSLTPASNGVIPIQSSVDKAFMLVGSSGKLDLVPAENSVSTRRRPKSAPAAAHSRRFPEMNIKLRQHICDVMEARGKLSLLIPRDREKIFNLMLSGVESSAKDEMLLSMFNSGLQTRIN